MSGVSTDLDSGVDGALVVGDGPGRVVLELSLDTLIALERVIPIVLRKNQPFLAAVRADDRHTVVLIGPGIPLKFVYPSPDLPQLDDDLAGKLLTMIEQHARIDLEIPSDR